MSYEVSLRQQPSAYYSPTACQEEPVERVGGTYEPDAEGKRDGSPTPLTPAAPSFPPGTKFRYWDDAMMQFGDVLMRAAGGPRPFRQSSAAAARFHGFSRFDGGGHFLGLKPGAPG